MDASGAKGEEKRHETFDLDWNRHRHDGARGL